MNISYLTREGKPDLAYVHTQGHEPLIMFCGGYRSDMNGTKATSLETYCKETRRSYLRFDYSGHGQSQGEFNQGTIGAWLQDALDILDYIASKEVIIIGSSMGGWIALLLAHARPELIKAYIGIAPAPDFTEDMYARLSEEQKNTMQSKGYVEIPNDYSDEPYHYSTAFHEEAKTHYLLNTKQNAPCPMRILQGEKDIVVLRTFATNE